MNIYVLNILKLLLSCTLKCIPLLIGIVLLIVGYMVPSIDLTGILVLLGFLFIGPVEIAYLGYLWK